MAAAHRALAIARRGGVRTILNPAPAAAISDEMLALCDIVTPNETEAEGITGIAVTDIETARQAAAARWRVVRGLPSLPWVKTARFITITHRPCMWPRLMQALSWKRRAPAMPLTAVWPRRLPKARIRSLLCGLAVQRPPSRSPGREQLLRCRRELKSRHCWHAGNAHKGHVRPCTQRNAALPHEWGDGKRHDLARLGVHGLKPMGAARGMTAPNNATVRQRATRHHRRGSKAKQGRLHHGRPAGASSSFPNLGFITVIIAEDVAPSA